MKILWDSTTYPRRKTRICWGKWKNLVYEKNGYVCTILIPKYYVNLEFWRELKIPKNLLEDTGKKIILY